MNAVYYGFVNRLPIIEPDAILTCGMLRDMAAFPHVMLALSYSGFGDGFVAGLDFEYQDGSVVLTPGIVRSKGRFYILGEKFDLGAFAKKYCENPVGNNFRLVLGGTLQRRIEEGVRQDSLPLYVLPEREPADGLTLAIFSDQRKELALPAPEAEDPLEEYGQAARLNLLETPWACPGGATFHPLVFRGIAHKLENKVRKTAFDCALLMEICNHCVASFGALRIYILNQGGEWPENDRRRIFKELCGCLDFEAPVSVMAAPGKAPSVSKDSLQPPTIL